VDVPAGNKDHVVVKVFPLNLGFLHHHNVRLQNLKHCLVVNQNQLRAKLLLDSKWQRVASIPETSCFGSMAGKKMDS
jgi:hypothetical protein